MKSPETRPLAGRPSLRKGRNRCGIKEQEAGEQLSNVRRLGMGIPNSEALRKSVDENRFVADYRGGNIIYSSDFYIAMYKKIHDEGMTYVQAYNALGFDTGELETDRANSAGKRAMKMAEEDRLFTVKKENYRGLATPEEIGYDRMPPEEKLAYMEARNAYLECTIEAQKKPVRIGGEIYIFEKESLKDCRMYATDLMVRAQKALACGMCICECWDLMGYQSPDTMPCPICPGRAEVWKKEKAPRI